MECLFLFEKNKSILKEVSTGIQDDQNIQILSGISDSVEVIIGPYSAVSKRLTDNMQVTRKQDK